MPNVAPRSMEPWFVLPMSHDQCDPLNIIRGSSLTRTSTTLCVICNLMFRSTPLRTILSRSSATPTTPAVRRSLRPFSSPRPRYASTSSSTAPSRTTSLPVLLCALTCTLLGYTIGSSADLPSPLASLGLGRQQVSTEDDQPTYGTPEDFRQAIQELRHIFSNEGHESTLVSTNPDDLQVHGFSENDYHPGTSHSLSAVGTPIVLSSNCFTFAAVNHVYALAGLYRCPSYSSGVSKQHRRRG